MARRPKGIATLVGGDARVIAHPAFRDVPEPRYPLKTDKAKAEYERVVMILFNASRLTNETHLLASTFALHVDGIERKLKKNQIIPTHAIVQHDRALRALKIDDSSSPIAAPEGAAANRYSLCGFASRRRQAV
jgi:hypothetical protein